MYKKMLIETYIKIEEKIMTIMDTSNHNLIALLKTAPINKQLKRLLW